MFVKMKGLVFGLRMMVFMFMGVFSPLNDEGSQDGSARFWLFDDIQEQQANTLYVHNFSEHTTCVTDIFIDYGGCNAMIVSASEDHTCKSIQKHQLMSESTMLFSWQY